MRRFIFSGSTHKLPLKTALPCPRYFYVMYINCLGEDALTAPDSRSRSFSLSEKGGHDLRGREVLRNGCERTQCRRGCEPLHCPWNTVDMRPCYMLKAGDEFLTGVIIMMDSAHACTRI